MGNLNGKSRSSRIVIFFHIPKTAGQTLNTVIQRQYNPAFIYRTKSEAFWESLDSFKALPNVQRNSYRMIMGHMIFGFHEFLSRPYTYLTILRDPIERIVSYYYYILRYSGNYLHDIVTSQKMSLKELVSSGISKEFNNLQVRRLSGNDKIHFGQCSSDMLEQAIQNLHLHFGVVGTVRRFDEALMLMKTSFGWKNCFYERKNVTRNKPKISDIPRDDIAIIEEYNKLDINLYEYVETMFEAQIGQLGENFQREVNKFRSLNKLYKLIHPAMSNVKNNFFQKNPN